MKEKPTRKFLEKDFQTKFNRWLKYVHKRTGAFELKATDGGSLAFNAVQEHQSAALLSVKHSSLVFKIPDLGNQNPFDCFMLGGEDAYIVIMFHAKRREQKEFVMIDIDAWVKEEESSDRRSLTEERAFEIGQRCFLG